MQNLLQMQPESRAALEQLRERHGQRVAARCDAGDTDLFWLRLEGWFEDARTPLLALYGDRSDVGAQADAIFDCVVDGYLAWPAPLRLLDLERQMTPD